MFKFGPPLLLSSMLLLVSGRSQASPERAPFLPSQPGFAEPRRCATVDYRSQLGPAKGQGETLYCFAYASADLIEQRIGKSISAIDLATTYFFVSPERIRRTSAPLLQSYFKENSTWAERIASERESPSISILPIEVGGTVVHPMFHKLGGGTETTTLLLANAMGLCEDLNLPSDGGLNRYMDLIRQLEADALAHRSNAGPEVTDFPARFRSPEADAFNTQWLRWIDQRCHRLASPIPLIPVGYALAEDLPDYIRKVRAGRLTVADQQKVFASLDYALDHGRIASIGYDLDEVIRPGLPDSDPDDGEGSGDHASAVVGRRTGASGGCEYLIRDPSGWPCSAYKDQYLPRCKDHHVWLTEAELSVSLYSVVYLR